MSVNLLMDEETKPVVWRGPVIAGTVKQFWSEVVWNEVENSDKIVSFTRVAGGERVTFYANVSKEAAACSAAEGRVLIERGAKLGDSLCLEPYGYVIIKES